MSNYPGSVDTFRAVENLPGESYDILDTKTIYAEDINNHSSALEAVEDTLGVNPQGSEADVAARLAAIEASVIANQKKVGEIYISTSDSDPASTLGYGTWAAVGEGMVFAGKAPTGTFSTVGDTIGEETHTLDVGEIPSHSHQVGVGNGGSASSLGYRASGYHNSGSGISTGYFDSDTTGGGDSHNNIQPTLVVYAWERTA